MTHLPTKLTLIAMIGLLVACSAFAESGERPRYYEYYPESLQHMPASAYYGDKAQIALLRAAADGDVKAMEQAVKDGADVNRIGRDGMAPLYWVMAQGSLTGTQWLLEHGADPNRYTLMPKAWQSRSYHESAMSLAVDQGDPVIVRTLLEHGGDPNQVPWRGGVSLLMYAAGFGKLALVRMLIKYGADINSPDESGYTPLLGVVSGGRYDIALQLLKAGADPTIKNKFGFNAIVMLQVTGATWLDNSSRQAYPKMIHYLQQRGYIPKSFKFDPEHPDRTWPKDAKP